MKSLLRLFLLSTITVWLLDRFIPGFNLGDNLQTITLTSAALMFVTLIVIPLLSIIFLPINLITIGLFRWVLTGAAFYAFIRFASFIELTDWIFPGWTLAIPIQFVSLPPLSLPSFTFTLWTNLLLLAIGYNLLMNLFNWLCSD